MPHNTVKWKPNDGGDIREHFAPLVYLISCNSIVECSKTLIDKLIDLPKGL